MPECTALQQIMIGVALTFDVTFHLNPYPPPPLLPPLSARQEDH